MHLRPCINYYWGKLLSIILAIFVSAFLALEINYLLILPGLLLAFILLSAVIFHRYAHIYIITPEYLETRRGLVSIESVEIACRDIRAVVVRQGVFGRMLGYGDIEISTAANGQVKAVLVGIRNPQGIRDIIREFRGIGGMGNLSNNNADPC